MVHLGPITVTVAEDGGRGRKTFYYEPAHFGRRDYMPGAVMRRDGQGSWCSLPIGEMKRRAPPASGTILGEIAPGAG